MNENTQDLISFDLEAFLTYGAIWMAIWIMWAAIWAYQYAADRRLRYRQRVAEAVRKLQEHSDEHEVDR